MDSPLYNAIRKYSEEGILPFHMPGHKMGKGIFEEFKEWAFKMDVTEVPGTDNLHFPEGCIKEAQEAAAKAFGSERTYFLVNGSTSGVYAMVMAVCNPGDKIIAARDSHKALMGALVLGDIIPVYVMPEIVDGFNIPGGINPESLEKVMEENQDAKAVFLTYPNYYGICSDISRISQLVERYGMKLIVDEAHGAHFNFHNELPPSAISLGAHLSVQSAHKTLPALTQSAYLHVSHKLTDIGRLESMLRLTQTSSPSYLLMVSLDIARWYMENFGHVELERIINKCKNVKEMLKCKYINIIDEKLCGKYGINAIDHTRLVFNFNSLNHSGYEVEKCLRKNYNIQLEMSDIYNTIAICTVADEDKDIDYLVKSISEIVEGFGNQMTCEKINRSLHFDSPYGMLPQRAMDPRKAEFSEGEYVSIQNSRGRVSKSVIAPYPPGIPLICPGEVVDEKSIVVLQNIINAGGHVNGIMDNMINVVK